MSRRLSKSNFHLYTLWVFQQLGPRIDIIDLFPNFAVFFS